MSNLQVLARRCPVMGKALAVQSKKVYGMSMYHSQAKAGFHSMGKKEARAVDVVRGDGEFLLS